MKRRKPTKKDIIFGCWNLFWDMIISFMLFRHNRAELDWCLLRLTAKGDFEVSDDERKDVRNERIYR